MKNITLEQILMLYYFRKVNQNNANHAEYDNDIVRVYYERYARQNSSNRRKIYRTRTKTF